MLFMNIGDGANAYYTYEQGYELGFGEGQNKGTEMGIQKGKVRPVYHQGTIKGRGSGYDKGGRQRAPCNTNDGRTTACDDRILQLYTREDIIELYMNDYATCN